MLHTNQIEKPHRVLIVDDQELNRDILGSILEETYTLLFACNGVEAMQILHEQAEDISLVMLDLIMPVMNGLEVLEEMQQEDSMKNIPVIVLTSERDAELKALQMGAVDFITKPFELHEVILARAERTIELSDGKQLILAAKYDKLTGLYNRSFFFEYAERLFAYHPEFHFDAVVLNIEQFHSINAVSGREFGDHVLHVLGSEILDFLNETKGIAGRYEADHFNMFCTHREDYAALLTHFQSKVDAISPNVHIRLRMGVMPWQDGLDPVSMLDYAKAACTKVRGNFQQPLMVCNDDMQKSELLDTRLLNDLNTAIAEDVDANAEILADILELEEIESERAENGQAAVDMFSSHPAGYYDAILMDVRMPVMDGLSATKAIRAMARKDAKRIPIIAMTANVFDEDVERSLEAGMNAHLSKPIEPEKIFETLAEWI